LDDSGVLDRSYDSTVSDCSDDSIVPDCSDDSTVPNCSDDSREYNSFRIDSSRSDVGVFLLTGF
jgi:hypothetical protein